MIYIYIWLWLSIGFAGSIDYISTNGKNWTNFIVGFVMSLIILPFLIPSMIFLILFRAMRLTQDK